MILSQNALQNACGKHQWQVITQDFAQFSERFLKLGLHTALGDPALGRDFAVGLAVDAPGRENLPRQLRPSAMQSRTSFSISPAKRC